MRQISKVWYILQHFHCAFTPSPLDWWKEQMALLSLNWQNLQRP